MKHIVKDIEGVKLNWDSGIIHEHLDIIVEMADYFKIDFDDINRFIDDRMSKLQVDKILKGINHKKAWVIEHPDLALKYTPQSLKYDTNKFPETNYILSEKVIKEIESMGYKVQKIKRKYDTVSYNFHWDFKEGDVFKDDEE